ncbi:unnamed protein product [Symbiodinium sp. CCMP2592]|nr:unnamed protein product [Symbiodinium sp. CCMP2592]
MSSHLVTQGPVHNRCKTLCSSLIHAHVYCASQFGLHVRGNGQGHPGLKYRKKLQELLSATTHSRGLRSTQVCGPVFILDRRAASKDARTSAKLLRICCAAEKNCPEKLERLRLENFPGYPPDSPPVPRFFKSKESKVVKAVKREETLESVSQGSTAASRGFFANYSDDENSEPDLSSNALSLRGPPGLCQQAPPVTAAPSLESSASHASPTSPNSGREIFRRLQELETLKAALSQLEAEERIAIAQANARPDPAWDPSIWFSPHLTQNPAVLGMEGAEASGVKGSHGENASVDVEFSSGCAAMLRAPEPSGLGRSWPPAAPLSHSQSFQPSLLSTVANPSFQDLQIPPLLGPSLSGAVPAAQAFVSGRADPDPAPISPTDLATHRKQAPAEFAVQKGINQELLAASATEDEGCALQVLAVASKYVDQMNGVNLSTAIHRIARACQRFKNSAEQAPSFVSLVVAAERMVLQELEHRDSQMPVKCCTIIAWSCASLRVFRNSLFKALARLATVSLEQCQSYEMTNIMWAFGELCKSRRQLSKDLKEDLRNLLEATCSVFIARPIGWKLQVLMSALVSLTILPWQPCSQRLFTDIAREVAGRQQELANEKTKPLAMAFHELRTKKPQAFKEIMMALQDFPDFVAHPSLRGNRSEDVTAEAGILRLVYAARCADVIVGYSEMRLAVLHCPGFLKLQGFIYSSPLKTCQKHALGGQKGAAEKNCPEKLERLRLENLPVGYPPDSPPVPRFFKSKESKVVKAVKREETLESVSQGSTAASRGFFANYSDDENSEPDLSSNALSLRGPPGLCQQAPPVTAAPSLESSASHASPTSPNSGREIFRRLQELETLKAALSQLEAEERIAIAQANARPDPAWDPSVWK